MTGWARTAVRGRCPAGQLLHRRTGERAVVTVWYHRRGCPFTARGGLSNWKSERSGSLHLAGGYLPGPRPTEGPPHPSPP